jgi:hypothetical protein
MMGRETLVPRNLISVRKVYQVSATMVGRRWTSELRGDAENRLEEQRERVSVAT